MWIHSVACNKCEKNSIICLIGKCFLKKHWTLFDEAHLALFWKLIATEISGLWSTYSHSYCNFPRFYQTKYKNYLFDWIGWVNIFLHKLAWAHCGCVKKNIFGKTNPWILSRKLTIFFSFEFFKMVNRKANLIHTFITSFSSLSKLSHFVRDVFHIFLDKDTDVQVGTGQGSKNKKVWLTTQENWEEI